MKESLTALSPRKKLRENSKKKWKWARLTKWTKNSFSRHSRSLLAKTKNLIWMNSKLCLLHWNLNSCKNTGEEMMIMKFLKMLYCAQLTKRTQEPTVTAVVIAPLALYF